MRKLCIETTDQSSIEGKESVLVCRYWDADLGFGSSMRRYSQISIPMIYSYMTIEGSRSSNSSN